MKASEVVKRYQQGERDFRGVNLRGQSFRGQDLSGADFSECDIRGTNFKNANLREAKFCKAKTGLQKRWAVFLVFISWLLSGILGFFSLFAVGFIAFIFNGSEVDYQVVGWISLVLLIVLFVFTIRRGLGGAVVAAAAFAATVPFAVGFAGHVAFAVPFAVAGAVAGAVAFAGVVALGVGGAVAADVVVPFAVAGAFTFTGVGAYLGWRAIRGDPRDAWIRSVAIAFAATKGTSFYNADLTDADFTGARLKSTDLREANLTRTCWRDAIKLDRARPGQTILANTAVRELLVSGYGYKKLYIRLDFRGANLVGVNLNQANLKLADLSEATLAQANLDGANLTQANAVGTDFTGASMTGACLEAWNIESTTKLDQVDCQYVFLLEHFNEHGSRERRPSSGVFQPGEFTKLFEEVLDTVDLIFRNGVDWKAFVDAFKKVQVENEDTPLEIQTIENKGDGVVVVKVKVPSDTDKEKIHQDFTQNYELALKAVEEKYKAVLAAKEEQIQDYRQQSADMMEIVKLQASRPINVEAKAVAEQPTYDQRGASFGGGFAGRDYKGDVTHNYAQQGNLAEAAAEIQQLLQQLSQTYPTSTNKEKMAVVAEAVDQIESNPTLKARVINALKAGGTETLKEAIDHPLVNILMATIEGWQEAE